MSDGRGTRVALEAGFLVVVAAVLGVAHVRPLWIVLVMFVAWAIVAALEWAAWREEPHWASGQPPRYYVPKQPLPPRPPSDELPAFGGYPRHDRPEPRAAEAPTWIAPPELREELFGWPTHPPSEDTVEEPFPTALDGGPPEEAAPGPPLEALPAPIEAAEAEPPALEAPPEAAAPLPVEEHPAAAEPVPEGPESPPAAVDAPPGDVFGPVENEPAPAEPVSAEAERVPEEPETAAAPAWPPASPAHVRSAAVEQEPAEAREAAEPSELPEERLPAANAGVEPLPALDRAETDAADGSTEAPGPGTRLVRHRLDPFEAPAAVRWPWQRRTEPVAVAELPPLPRHVRIEPTDGDDGG